ncbi:unnamed protein product [Durusdinium trenchii]|uniref:Endonuclease/exonuclease/phosphatase domain-containing protein n=1 Tax=Durusdinium trenchii TaxID=1381693 RepID=A0ABP0J4D5_9DINO
MLRTMADGTFDPDLPRAAQVDRQVNQLLMEVGATDDGFVVGLRPPTAVDEVMSDGTDVDNALDIEDGADQAELDVVCIDAEKAAGLVTQHRSSGVLHFVASHDKLTCGRKISKAYAIVEEDLVVKWPLCRQCRRSGGSSRAPIIFDRLTFTLLSRVLEYLTRRPTVRYLIPGQGQAFASGDATCACTASAIRGSVFVDAALTAKHPIDYAFPLPDALLEAVAKLISDGPKLTIARRKLALKKAKQQPLLEVLPDIPDLQTSWLLLLYCPSPRVHYALRGICPDLTKHFATERDNAVHTCLRRLLQQPNELPRPAIDTAAAHWASWQDPTPILRQKMPQVFDTIQQQIENPELPSLQCLQHVTAFLTSLGLDAPPCTQCQPAPPAPTSPHDHADTLRGWQRHASHITDTALKQEHIAHFTAPSQHLLESQCGPLAARIFTLFPVSHELVLDSSHFRLLLLQRLRLPCPSCQRAADVNSNDAPMAWNGEKFTAIEGPGVVWVARDKYGDRHVNWVRLQVVGSSETILFANTHGPLDQCGGKPGGTVATNYINAVNQHKKTKDVVIFTGDFNCGSNQDTIKQLSEAYQLDATDTSYNGADHIFSSSGFSVLWKGASDGSPSDHQLLKAVLQSGSHSRCPVPPDNGGCCLTCRFNHYCPSNKGCYASGQSGCSGGYCPAPPEVEIVV